MAKNDYTKGNKEDLIDEIKQLRKRRKYGLAWEEKPEEVVEQRKTELPVLQEVKGKEILTDPSKPVNLLIEGDNYHALSALNYTHKGKVALISDFDAHSVDNLVDTVIKGKSKINVLVDMDLQKLYDFYLFTPIVALSEGLRRLFSPFSVPVLVCNAPNV